MKDKLEAEGYFVIRAAGSHGVADLVAIRAILDYDCRHDILFVSCKVPEYAPPSERKALIEAAEKFGAIAMMTVKVKGKWTLERVKA